MKKKIRIVIVILLSVVIGFLAYKITIKLQHKTAVAERIKTLPTFSFTTTEGAVYTDKDLPNKPVIFVYFNSDCEYCKSEATKIQERLVDFKNTYLVFVSFEETASIVQFAKTYQLDNKENITFLEDRKGEFSKLFDVNSIPYTVVYNKNRKLLQKFKGATKIDNILKVLK